MRITIGHREEAAGLSRAKRHYYIDCQVLFSEEERAIIGARGLAKHNFSIDPAVPPPVQTQYIGAKLLRGIAPFVLLGSCVGGVAIGDRLGVPLFLLAAGMFAGSFFLRRKTDFAELPNQTITLDRLLDDPRLTVYAVDPAHAKYVDDLLRAKLGTIKALLIDSTELRSRETFEL